LGQIFFTSPKCPAKIRFLQFAGQSGLTRWQFGQNGLVTSPLLRYSCEGAFEPTNRSASGKQDGATLILCAVDRFGLLRRGLVAEESGRMIGLAARVYLSSKLGVGPNADQAEVCEKFE
jgi:hypothetical protein